MTITFSSGCPATTPIPTPSPVAGYDSCYANFVITAANCTITVDNQFTPCQCDASGNCSGVSVAGTPTADATQAIPCNGQPIPFPSTGSSEFSVSGSCTYKKAGSATTNNNTSAGISLTKSNMLIAASLVLCAVIGSF
ncbi:hypothetical protein K450DRAFT_242317 [Umbelopsis ramanniana AG]|uniref:Uncharacterized protein n=1 Tax=Umbelopsis ramanniana AG TaxID=1314678 RepID=A0AAD5HCQ3_UMBRA|nr:uncharacterized protein K450DRAFT_242317 [Umbelopsis ramanniana AG]KAI8579480.1 hypothetical protein K450DRAFT_242317 [Umbelopsis ramanniana AG]